MPDLAVIALTPRGLDLARRVQKALGHGSIVDASERTRQVLQKAFQQGRPMLCIMALGIVVRSLASVIQDKENDPPVVVMDEAGRFVISVLGGHAAGANKLAADIAAAIKATAVITTASDSLQVPAVDLIGQKWGWKIDGKENLTRVAAAIVKGERIGVYQDTGRRDWWESFGAWPHHFERLDGWPSKAKPENNHIRLGALLGISDRILPTPPSALERLTVIYRPASLTIGVGCRRGVSRDEVDECVTQLFDKNGLHGSCLTAMASVSLKKDEPALVEYADFKQIPFLTYVPHVLSMVGTLPNPSERVRKLIGVPGVCEPAAMLAAGVQELVVPKTKFKRITLAVARRPLA